MGKTLFRLGIEGVLAFGTLVALASTGQVSGDSPAPKQAAQRQAVEEDAAPPAPRPAVRRASFQAPAPDRLADQGVVVPADDPSLDPRRPRPNHARFCTPHNGCHEICNEPHPIYSTEGNYSSPGYTSEHMKPKYTRCATCTPSRAQLMWLSKLPNVAQLRRDYSDNEIIHYFGDDRLRHLAGDFLPPELDPEVRIRNGR